MALDRPNIAFTVKDLVVSNDLTVSGTTTTLSTTNTVVSDKLMELANGTSGTPSGDAGIIVERGSSTNAGFVWDESADTWVACTTSATGASTGDLTLTPAKVSASDATLTSTSTQLTLKYDGDSSATVTVDGSSNTTIAAAETGDIILDAPDQIHLDADGGMWKLLNGGALKAYIQDDSSDIVIHNETQDNDIKFSGNDGGSGITALTLDMSDAGTATFNNDVKVTGDIIIDDGGSLKEAGGTAALTFDGSADITTLKIPAGTVAQAADHIMFFDGGATGAPKVESIDDFLTAIAGSGISVSSSQLTSSSGTGSMDSFQLEDDDGTEVTINNAKEVKFIGSGITTNWTDTSTGSDGDPYDLTFTVDAAQTGITSILATDIKIGEDDETKIDFETADEIHFYGNNVNLLSLTNANSGDAVLEVPTADKKFTIKGTDGSSAITALDIDMAAAGNAAFNGVVTAAGFTIGSAAITEAELEIIDGATVTTAELNLIDGDTARGTTAVADGDGFLHNDGGTMRMTDVSTLASLFASGTGLSASSSVISVDAAQTGITSLLATDIKIGEDDQTKIDFEDVNTINLYTNNAKTLSLHDGGDLKLLTDGASLFFGANSEIELRHVHDNGLILKHVGTGDGKMPTLTFQAGDNDIAANDELGVINFQAPDEGAGTDAVTVAAGIAAVSEGDFSASNNATKLSFRTGASETATEKMTLSSAGLLTCDGGFKTNTLTIDGDASTDVVQSDGPLKFSANAGMTFTAANDIVFKSTAGGPELIIQDASGSNTLRLLQDTTGATKFNNGGGNTVIAIDDGDQRLYFYDIGGEYIVSDGTDFSMVSGGDITFDAGSLVKVNAPMEIEQGASGGAACLLIDNDDTDQIALDINAGNIDANVIDITCADLTESAAIRIVADGLTSGNAINVVSNSASTTARALVSLKNDHASANDVTGISLVNDSLADGATCTVFNAAMGANGSAIALKVIEKQVTFPNSGVDAELIVTSFIPAGAMPIALGVRMTTAITGGYVTKIGTPGDDDAFGTFGDNDLEQADDNFVCKYTPAGGGGNEVIYFSSNTHLKFTTNAVPSGTAGVARIALYYYGITAPTG